MKVIIKMILTKLIKAFILSHDDNFAVDDDYMLYVLVVLSI